MGEELAFKNGRISNFQGLVTLTLDQVIQHTVMYHSSTSTYIPNFIEIGIKNFFENHNRRYCQFQSHVTQKLWQKSKIRPW